MSVCVVDSLLLLVMNPVIPLVVGGSPTSALPCQLPLLHCYSGLTTVGPHTFLLYLKVRNGEGTHLTVSLGLLSGHD